MTRARIEIFSEDGEKLDSFEVSEKRGLQFRTSNGITVTHGHREFSAVLVGAEKTTDEEAVRVPYSSRADTEMIGLRVTVHHRKSKGKRAS